MKQAHAPRAALGLLGIALTAMNISCARADDIVKRGEYLATVGDCAACHTAPGGEKFAGGLYLKTPFGSIPTPNITPDNETGIGTWTDDQFYRAMHEGIGAKGEYLYPAFPFPWYTKVTKDDALAIHAYLKSLKPIHAQTKPLEMGFPFNVRTSLLTWRTLFFKPQTFDPDPKDSAEVNRGAYLVEGLGHCGECHNRSKLTGASDWSGKLEGGKIEGWYAPNITSDGSQGVGQWKSDEIVTYLRTGARPDHKSVAVGPMKETITESTSKMSDGDLKAIAAYLKSVAAKKGYDEAQSSAGAPAPKDQINDQAYLTWCSSCHQRDGNGIPNAVPALAGNGAVTAAGPENVIRAVLGGLAAQNGLAPMPALGQQMSDQEVADVVNYVRSAWGNNAPANAGPGAVGELRKDALTMLAMNQQEACAPISDQSLKAAIDKSEAQSKLAAMDTGDMLTTIKSLIPEIKKVAPQAKPDALTNALTAAYCPIVMEKTAPNRRSKVLGDFAVLTYGETSGKKLN